MKVSVTVKDREEGQALLRGLMLPDVRAVVIMAGILDALPTQEDRDQVIRYAACVAHEDRDW